MLGFHDTRTRTKAGGGKLGKLPRPPTPSGVGVVLHAVVVVVVAGLVLRELPVRLLSFLGLRFWVFITQLHIVFILGTVHAYELTRAPSLLHSHHPPLTDAQAAAAGPAPY